MSKPSLGMSELSESDPIAKNAKWFERFADQTGSSQMYRSLALRICKDYEILKLTLNANPQQPIANLFLAAVNYLLKEQNDHQLASFYPNLGGAFVDSDIMYESFRNFCFLNSQQIENLLKTKLVQTNEVQRISILLPALLWINNRSQATQLALFDIGTSAGLNLLIDKALVRYSNGQTIGVGNSPLQLNCKSHGQEIFTSGVLNISNKIGIDLNPINLQNSEERLWNEALLWPDQPERLERFRTAAELLRLEKIKFTAGSATDVLEKSLQEITGKSTICLMHSFVLNQFSGSDRDKFHDSLLNFSKQRDIWRISLEWIGSETPELVVFHYHKQSATSWKLANSHGHGEWIEWLI